MRQRSSHRRASVAVAALVGLAGAGLIPGTLLPAQAASGCSGGGQVCIRTFESGLSVRDVEVKLIHSDTINGHAHLYGDGYSENTPDQRLVGGFCAQGRCNNTTQQLTFHVNRTFPEGSLLCAEIWQQRSGGGYDLRRRPCLTMHS